MTAPPVWIFKSEEECFDIMGSEQEICPGRRGLKQLSSPQQRMEFRIPAIFRLRLFSSVQKAKITMVF